MPGLFSWVRILYCLLHQVIYQEYNPNNIDEMTLFMDCSTQHFDGSDIPFKYCKKKIRKEK